MSEVAVSIKNLKKHFHLLHEKEDSIKLKVTNSFKKSRRKGHDEYRALKGINLDIKKGEFIGILGRNGAGKSTLLKIIAEIYQPSSGSIKVNGRLVPFIELGVGFNKNLSGRDNVYLNGAMLGFSRKEVDKMYDSIVDFSELRDFMDQKLKNYSSGMQVRLAFSVAIQADADILLLDEVLAVGDADFKRKCYEYFKSLKQQKKTIIFVTHGMSAVREYCDRAILIEDGKVAYDGTPDEIADEYLKMFNKSSSVDSKKPTSKRWGTQDIAIDKMTVDVQNDEINIYAMLKASNTAYSDVKFGFTIKDKQGKVLAGASNLNAEGAQKMQFKPGETKELFFSMPNIFGNQTYTVGATLTLPDGVTMFDKWEDVTEFNNTRDDVYYPIVCPAKLTIR